MLLCYHYGPGGSHFGFDKTYSSIKAKYYWPNMYRDIENHIKSCDACQKASRAYHAESCDACQKASRAYHAESSIGSLLTRSPIFKTTHGHSRLRIRTNTSYLLWIRLLAGVRPSLLFLMMLKRLPLSCTQKSSVAILAQTVSSRIKGQILCHSSCKLSVKYSK